MNRFRMIAALAALASLPALAQQYPARPVKIIVAFTAGGTTDIMARTLAQRLSERFKQPFVVENKPGAGGNLGTEVACRAAADGYTLIVNSVGPMAVNPTLYKNLGCNPPTGLPPGAQISHVPNVVESGFPGFEAGWWFGVFAPRGMPAEVIALLNKATNEIIAEKSVEARMVDEVADPAGGSPEKFGAFVKSEYEKWRTVVK